MATTVVSILKAKKGEFEALEQTTKANADALLPLFEISPITNKMRTTKKYKESSAPTELYLNGVADEIARVWKGRPTLFDAFRWPFNSTTESGEHAIAYMHNRLVALGVNVYPTIGYDRWGSAEYRAAMKGIGLHSESYFCLRLDSHAIEDSAEPEYFAEQINDVVETLGLNPALGFVLVDFADVTSISLETMLEQSKRVIDLLLPIGFNAVSAVGCSMPSFINKAVKNRDSTGKVLRKESLLWQTLRIEYPNLKVFHGDYGVRAPNSAEDMMAPDTNCKIRYTIENAYFVVRGHSQRIGNKGAQTYDLAMELRKSPHFMGADFSWGDERVVDCSNEEFKGSHGDWVAIDTNHHIAWVVAEVREFEFQLANATSRADSPSNGK